MKFKFFRISATDFEEDESELNIFCASKRVAEIDKQFVSVGENSFWSFCISYIEKDNSQKLKGKIDYKEVFDEKDFALFAKLRELRKRVAESEGVPAYALFTNEQLAIIVREKVTTLEGLSKISGVGKSRIDKYGQRFVDVFKQETDRTESKGE